MRQCRGQPKVPPTFLCRSHVSMVKDGVMGRCELNCRTLLQNIWWQLPGLSTFCLPLATALAPVAFSAAVARLAVMPGRCLRDCFRRGAPMRPHACASANTFPCVRQFYQCIAATFTFVLVWAGLWRVELRPLCRRVTLRIGERRDSGHTREHAPVVHAPNPAEQGRQKRRPCPQRRCDCHPRPRLVASASRRRVARLVPQRGRAPATLPQLGRGQGAGSVTIGCRRANLVVMEGMVVHRETYRGPCV